mgnify:CR=1 FL=1
MDIMSGALANGTGGVYEHTGHVISVENACGCVCDWEEHVGGVGAAVNGGRSAI